MFEGPDAQLTGAVWPADGVRVTLTAAMVSAAAETLSGFQVETKGPVSTSVQLLPDSPRRDAITMWQAEINQTLCPNSTLHTHSQSSLCTVTVHSRMYCTQVQFGGLVLHLSIDATLYMLEGNVVLFIQ